MKSEKAFSKGQLNRSRIVNELLKSPLTFSQLKKEVGLSGKTLAKHLKDLSKESLVKREIQGKYIVYKIAKPQTVLNLRKSFREELNHLLWIYGNCLNEETSQLFNQVDMALKRSIDQPDWRADLTLSEKTYPIPSREEDKIITMTQDQDKYKKPRIDKKPIPKRKRKLRKREL